MEMKMSKRQRRATEKNVRLLINMTTEYMSLHDQYLYITNSLKLPITTTIHGRMQ